MKLLQKLVSFTICASVFILALPLVYSSQDHPKATGHSSNKNNIHKLNPRLMFEITLHGFLLWASMGFLMPVGILFIRMSNREQCGRRLKVLFYVHAILQIIAVLLATAGAVMSLRNFNNSFSNHHQRIGVALYGIIWLQALVGFVRPHRGSKRRSVWFFLHWLLGTAASLLGVVNIYTGLQAYHEMTSRSIKVWVIIFTVEMSVVSFFYLLQDKWVYTQKQGVILGDQTVKPTGGEEIAPETSKRS